MKRTLAITALLLSAFTATSQKDSVRIQLPRHFFNTVFLVDGYRKPEVAFPDTLSRISRKLKTYSVRQLSLWGYTPLVTTLKPNADSSVVASSHLLLTFNYCSLDPGFSGDADHRLSKVGVGLRYIVNSGQKGVWYLEASPFLTRDATQASRPYLRLASTVLYSHNVSMRFNWRLGITKSFTWGNRFYLPFIGLRIGRLDGVNLSIQIPRSIQLAVPVTPVWIVSLYSKPQGGMYVFGNGDSLYPRASAKYFHFTRYEVNSGLRVDGRVAEHFSFYVAAGISTHNNVTFYSENSNPRRRKLPYSTYFFRRDLPATLYMNAGFVLYFGRTRSFYNQMRIYDALDINNTMGGKAASPLPIVPLKRTTRNLKGVQDLVDYHDF